MTYSPTIRRRRLSMALREYRLSAGLDSTAVATRLGWDPSKVSRMERDAWRRPNRRDITDLLDVYGVNDPDEREAMITLANESRHRGWWADYQDVFRNSLPDFEAGASGIRVYCDIALPGLLQTKEYAEAVFRASGLFDDHAISRRVQARLARQHILDQEQPPEFVAVIDEAALRRLVGGPAVMAQQLDRLVAMAGQPHITVQVVPFQAGAHSGMSGSFIVLDYASEEDSGIVYEETATESLYLETPEKLATYTLIHDRLRNVSLTPDESVEYMAGIANQLR